MGTALLRGGRIRAVFAQAGLLTSSYWLLYRRLCIRQVPVWARCALLLVVLLGPVAFWLNDHPNIGWHTELTYLPLALYFALALTSRSQYRLGWVILTGLLITLVKEDGAVLAALIHLSWLALSFLRQPGRSIAALTTRRPFWQISLLWMFVFVVGMIWLSAKNKAPEPRLQHALTLLAQNIGTRIFWKEMGKLVLSVGLLLVPAVGLLLLLARSQATKVVIGWGVVFGLGIAVLTTLNFVQSVLYYGEPLFYLVSLTWPPRFVLLWAFVAAFFFLCLVLYRDTLPSWPASVVPLVLAGLWLLQLPLLYLARPDFPSPSDWLRTLRGQPAQDKNPAFLQRSDLAVVQCLADQLPHQSSVFVFDYLVPYFHHQYEIWPTGNQYQPADIAIIPTTDPQHLAQTRAMPKADTIFQLKAYTIYAGRAYAPLISSCLSSKQEH